MADRLFAAYREILPDPSGHDNAEILAWFVSESAAEAYANEESLNNPGFNASGFKFMDLDSTDFQNASGDFVKNLENLGGAVQIFVQKDAEQNAEIRTLLGGSGIITVASGNVIRFDWTHLDDFNLLDIDVTQLRTDFDNSSGIFVKDGTNIGGAEEVFFSKNASQNLEFRTILGGSGVNVTTSGNILRVDAHVINGQNLGTASGVFIQRDVDGNLEFRTIRAGTGIGINQSATELEVFNTLSTEATSASNVGIGSGEIFAQEVGNDLQFRRLLAGSGIQIATSGNTVRIDNQNHDDLALLQTEVTTNRTDFDNSSGVFQNGTDTADQVRIDFDNSSGIFVKDGENLGAGSGVFFQKDTDQNLEFRTIRAGSNIGINQSATELEIFATIPGGGEANTASNVKCIDSSGIGVFHQKVTQDLQFHSLEGSSTINPSTSGITVELDPCGSGIIIGTSGILFRADTHNFDGGVSPIIGQSQDGKTLFLKTIAGNAAFNTSITDSGSGIEFRGPLFANVGTGGGTDIMNQAGGNIDLHRILGGSGIIVDESPAGVSYSIRVNVLRFPENVIYVGKHGNNPHDGFTIDQSKLTFASGILAAQAQSPDKDNPWTVVCLDAGVYHEQIQTANYIDVYAPNAKIWSNAVGANTVLIQDNSVVTFDEIESLTASAAVATQNPTDGRARTVLKANIINASGQGAGIANAGSFTGEFVANIGILNVGSGHPGTQGRIGVDCKTGQLDVNCIVTENAVATGVGLTSNDADFDLQCNFIGPSGTLFYLEEVGAKVNANVNRAETDGTLYDLQDASNILTLVAGQTAGTRTAVVGATVRERSDEIVQTHEIETHQGGISGFFDDVEQWNMTASGRLELKTIGSPIQNDAGASTITVDFETGYNHRVDLSQDATLAFINPRDGEKYILILEQNASGLVTWPSTMRWQFGIEPTLTVPGGKDIVSMMYDDASGVYYGTTSFGFA